MNLRFKGWRGRAAQFDLPPRLLLSGSNGSGKTNIIDAISTALTGEAPGRLGKAAARLVPYLDDGATTCLEGANPFWSATAVFKKTPKSAKLEHAVRGTPPTLRPLFVDFGAFLDSPAERKRLLDGLLEVAEDKVLASARAGAQEAAREVLAPETPAWTEKAVERLVGVSIQAKMALLSPTKEELATALSDIMASYKAAKGAAEVACSQAEQATGRDPLTIAAEVADARNLLAKHEAQDRDARSVLARREALTSRIARLRAVDPERRVRAEAELARLERITAPDSSVWNDLKAKLDATVQQGRTENERFKALKAGTCPTCGSAGENLKKAVEVLRLSLVALGKRRDELQMQANEAEKAFLAASKTYQDSRGLLRDQRGILANLPIVDPAEIARLEEELAGLPAAFLSGEELDAVRLRIQRLEQEAEVSRNSRAQAAVVSSLNLPMLELAGKALRAAGKRWETGKAAAYSEVVGPIAARMAEALGSPVTIDPENNWTVTIKDRAAESFSGGQRLAIWGGFVGALAKPGDILLCEAAEADLTHLGALLSALESCPAALVVVATHHHPTVEQALEMRLGNWVVLNPAEVAK